MHDLSLRSQLLIVGGLWIVLLVALLLIMGAAADAEPADPGAVQARWVRSLLEGDLHGARALLDPAAAGVADRWVRTIQDYAHNPASPTGGIEQVSSGPVQIRGAQRVVVSQWRFARRTWCFETIIARGERWVVVGFGQLPTCPAVGKLSGNVAADELSRVGVEVGAELY